MEEEKHTEVAAAPEKDAAAEAAAAWKREEALRQVEEMLSRDRAQKAQVRIDRLSHFSKHRYRRTVVMTEEQAYNPQVDLIEYQKPDTPEEEMTSEELAAEQKRQEAIRKINAMFLQQQAKRYARDYDARTVILPKHRKPIEENSVDIAGFLSQFRLSPEAQERFEKIRFGTAKGTVRPHFSVRLGSVVLPPMLLFVAWVLGQFPSLSAMAPVFGILALLLVPVAYYLHTWKLEYDSDAGIVKYHSLFHGTNLYEMQDMMGFMVSAMPDKPFPLSFLGMLDPRQYLVIHTPDHTINIPLLFSASIIAQPVEIYGYEGASDFYRCLTQYEHSLYSKQAAAEEKPAPYPVPVKPAPQKLETPEAVKAEKHAPVKPEPKAVTLEKPAVQETPAAPEKPMPAPKPEPVDLEKAREMFAKPAASVPDMPERGNDFPDPTKSAFPDPAQKPKPDVDVDALFEQVLRQHGKIK